MVVGLIAVVKVMIPTCTVNMNLNHMMMMIIIQLVKWVHTVVVFGMRICRNVIVNVVTYVARKENNLYTRLELKNCCMLQTIAS